MIKISRMLKKCLKNFVHTSMMFSVQSDTLLLADVFEKCRDTCIDIYGPDRSYLLSAPGLAWQAF